jgi:hypothetical protein
MPKKCKDGDSTEFQKEFPDNEACVKHLVEQPRPPELVWMKRSGYRSGHDLV